MLKRYFLSVLSLMIAGIFISSLTSLLQLTPQAAQASPQSKTSQTSLTDPPVATDDTLTATRNIPLVIPYTDLLANDNDPNGDPLTVVTDTNPVSGTLTASLGNWEVTSVDTEGNVGASSSLAEIGGHPAISYYDQTSFDLKYAYFDGTQWISATIDSFSTVGGASSLLELEGQPAISYLGPNSLKYATFDGTTWISTTLDTGSFAYTSMELIGGQPAISYYDQTLDDLKYASFNGISWTITTVDSADNVGSENSLAVIGGQPAISYADFTNNALKYATFDGTKWISTTVDAAGGRYTSLTVIGGQPAISYYNGAHTRYASFDGTNWISSTVDTNGYIFDTSIEEVDGQPAIAYYNKQTDLAYAIFDGTNWNVTIVDNDGYVGVHASMALIYGQPAISYLAFSVNNLKYAWLTPLGFTYTPPTDQCGSDSFTYHANDGALDSNIAAVNINILGCEPDANNDSYSTDEEVTLTVSSTAAGVLGNDTDPGSAALTATLDIDVSNGVLDFNADGTFIYTPTLNFDGVDTFTYIASNGTYSSTATVSITVNPLGDDPVAVDDNFTADLATSISVSLLSNDYDPDGDNLTVHFDTNPTLGMIASEGTAWAVSDVDTAGRVGVFSSLADINGKPAIAYYDNTIVNDDLKYAIFDGTNWISTTIDSTGAVGRHPSLLEINGQPAISYWDQSDGAVNYATFDGSDWTITTVDTEGFTGMFTSLKLIGGQPAIGYHSWSAHSVKYASFNGSSWDTTTVDIGDNVGYYLSLAEVNGQPAMSYLDQTNLDLKYASFDGSSWTVETVDSAGTVGWYTSLAEINGQPAITYYDTSNNALKYARFNGASWDFEVIDPEGSGGSHSSLMEIGGQPAVSYLGGKWDLRYATYSGASWDITVIDVDGFVGYHSSLAVVAGKQSISYYDHLKSDLKFAELESSGYTYTAPAGTCSTDTFTYHVNDGMNDSNIATVMIDIEGCVPSGGITGTVENNAMTPVVGAEAWLYENQGTIISPTWSLLDVDTIDGSGNYSFSGLETDYYAVRVTDPTNTYEPKVYNNALILENATQISVTDGITTPNINFTLFAGGRITGTVTLSDSTPVDGVYVMAFLQPGGTFHPRGAAVTDDNGEYSIDGLPAGTYIVRFADPVGFYGIEYYDDSETVESATTFAVSSGLTTPNINAVFEAITPVIPVDISGGGNDCNIRINENGEWVIGMRIDGSACTTTVTTPTNLVSCSDPDVPTNVRFLVGATATPLVEDPPGSGQYGGDVTIDSHGLSLSLAWDCGANPQTVDVGTTQLYDPSGYITEVGTGDPIPGATVTLYQVPGWEAKSSPADTAPNKCESHHSKSALDDWSQPAPTNLGVFAVPDPNLINPQINPQITDQGGYYGWDVAEGCWYVIVEAEGYLTLVSPVVGVPTEVTDLNLQLTPFTVDADAAQGVGIDLDLSWQPDPTTGCTYNVYQNTIPYFSPPDGMVIETTTSLTATAGGVTGDTITNYFFRIEATDCADAGSSVSNPVGEFDFAIVPGS